MISSGRERFVLPFGAKSWTKVENLRGKDGFLASQGIFQQSGDLIDHNDVSEKKQKQKKSVITMLCLCGGKKWRQQNHKIYIHDVCFTTLDNYLRDVKSLQSHYIIFYSLQH